MTYRVQLDVFEGPLDLLLHLIKKQEVDIYDIPAATITDAYLQYLELMEELNLDVAGEYLVMAATLLHIKSRMLLPASEADEEEADEDPRADLVNQLVAYQEFREAAHALGERAILARDVFRREPTPPAEPEGIRLRDVTLVDLLDAFREVVERASREQFRPFVTEEVSVRECAASILTRLERGPTAFIELFGAAPSRARLVATFLALLELVKQSRVRARQDVEGGTIVLTGIANQPEVPAV